MSVPHVIEPIVQKTASDCGLACLAIICGIPYATVSDAALKLVKNPHQGGLYTADFLRIAKKLGRPLKNKRKVDLEERPTGILMLSNHAVVVFDGVIFNPGDGLVYEADVYLQTKGYTPGDLLVREEGLE